MKREKDKYCQGCDEMVDKLEDIHNALLCDECNDKYDNKTGYCSLTCCLGYGCDGSC